MRIGGGWCGIAFVSNTQTSRPGDARPEFGAIREVGTPLGVAGKSHAKTWYDCPKVSSSLPHCQRLALELGPLPFLKS